MQVQEADERPTNDDGRRRIVTQSTVSMGSVRMLPQTIHERHSAASQRTGMRAPVGRNRSLACIYAIGVCLAPMLTIIEPPLFTKLWPDYWSEEERGAFMGHATS